MKGLRALVDLAERRLDQRQPAHPLAGVGSRLGRGLHQLGVRLAGDGLGILDLVPQVEGTLEHAQRLALVDRAITGGGH